MRRLHGLAVTTGLLFAAWDAGAAPPGTTSGPKPSSAQFALHHEEAGGADAAAARSRARAGDCKGALPSFDAAVRVTIEPTLRRDRGLCHEKLGDPYPAIDDFRAYLAARPDANDADSIREHLLHLEEQTGTGGRSEAKSADSGDQTGFEVKASTSDGGSSASTKSASSKKKRSHADKPTVTDRDYDEYVKQEKLGDDAEYAPLRYGEGLIIGPFVHLPRYFFNDGNTSDLSYAIGGTLRYATSGSFMVVSEFGYTQIGESGTNSQTSGPLFMLGGEFRVGLSRYNSDQLLLGLGLGFERYTNGGTGAGGASIVPLRAKLGYMHVFGPAIGLELAVDGGPAYYIPDDIAGFKRDNKVISAIGGSFALLIGF